MALTQFVKLPNERETKRTQVRKMEISVLKPIVITPYFSNYIL